jgi:ABC-type Fe3+/spermidine/putrescine transport system ATPase subunit
MAAQLGAAPPLALPTLSPHPDGPARAALRNEDLRVAEAADDPACCLGGRVVSRAYLGPRTRVKCALEAGPVVEADLPSFMALPAEGEPIRLAFDPARLLLFSPANGARLT